MIINIPKFIYCNMESPEFIYELIDPCTELVRYVGKTKNPKKRYKSHLYSSRKKRTHKECWINSLLTKGLKPVMRIKTVAEKNIINECEIDMISKYANLTNATRGGDGISEMTPEIKAKIRLTKFKKHMKFKPKKNGRNKPIVGYNLVSGEILTFTGAVEAASVLGFNQSHITSCCKKRNGFNSHKGYMWRYL